MSRQVALLAALAGVVSADHQFTDGSWTRLGYCDTRAASAIDFPWGTAAQMAQRATRVRICTFGSTVDCVTSNANSFPIEQIRAGRMMVSRRPAGTCCAQGSTCLRQVWTGPAARVNELMFRCIGGCGPRGEAETEAATPDMNYVGGCSDEQLLAAAFCSCAAVRAASYTLSLCELESDCKHGRQSDCHHLTRDPVPDSYQSCGNGGALHFSLNNATTVGRTAHCSWGASNGGWSSGRGRLELFIDFRPPTTTAAPTAPTMAPTSAPTGNDDPANVARRLGALEAQFSTVVMSLAAQINSATTSLATDASTTLATLTSVAVQSDDNTVLGAGLVANVTALSTGAVATSSTVSSLVSAVQAAVQNAVAGGGGSGLPQVSSTPTNDLVLSAGATVQVSSGTCSNNDLCGAASFASSLQQALQNL